MKTAVINIKTDPELKIKAQEVASDLGISLSMVLNSYLKRFVFEKRFFVEHNKSKLPRGMFRLSDLDQVNKDLKEIKSGWDKSLDKIPDGIS